MHLYVIFVVAVIGFTQCQYSFQEGFMRPTISLQVLQGALENSVQVIVTSSDGTAIGIYCTCVHLYTYTFALFVVGLDYREVVEVKRFNASNTSQSVILLIHDDNLVERDEFFTVRLQLGDGSNSNLRLLPNEVTITIEDRNGKYNAKMISTGNHMLLSVIWE